MAGLDRMSTVTGQCLCGRCGSRSMGIWAKRACATAGYDVAQTDRRFRQMYGFPQNAIVCSRVGNTSVSMNPRPARFVPFVHNAGRPCMRVC
jgi:hypothetical protein